MASPNNQQGGGVAALERLKSFEPPLFLSPSPSLSETARSASEYLFSSLKPFCPKAPFDTLLVEGFDAEQIWQQIDLQTKPLLSSLRREVKRFDKNPEEISKLFGGKIVKKDGEKKKEEVVDDEDEGEEDDGFEDFDELDDDEGIGGTDDDEDEDDGGGGDDDDKEEEEEDGGGGGIEDKFLKIKELEEYMEDDEAREYGFPKEKEKKKQKGSVVPEDEDDESDDSKDLFGEELGDEDEDDEDDEETGGFDASIDEEDDKLGTARYEDFFGGQKRKISKRKAESLDGSEDLDSDDEQEDEQDDEQEDEQDDEQEDEQDDDKGFADQNGALSTHEKRVKKLECEIKQIEKANLEPKTWTMQGEVTAMKRPKNSALEVDLDFEHNVRPAPVITEEVTASLEEIIKKRILEAHFDDVQKAPSMPSKAPKEFKELDENKSKEGLGKAYEDIYMEKTGLASAPLSFSDEQKKEASQLFKKLCLKLDALSHFHFTPKPIIEDISIQANVPALAMEEIAPVVVSDATMLAPEELFAGKGDIKEEAELTQVDRKRRRAHKKRKFKAETAKRMEKKARDNKLTNNPIGKDEP